MRKITYKFCILFLLFSALLQAKDRAPKEFMPSSLLFLDDLYSHNIILAEKSTHTIHLFENSGSIPKLVKSFPMLTGKKSGDKIFRGDHRTPEGLYLLTEFISHKELVSKYGDAGEIYGSGAFVISYPNIVDRRRKKTGGGIWLHSTNDETRIDKGLDSRGCVVTHNWDLKELSQYIELNKTNMVIVEELNMLSEAAWRAARVKLKNLLDSWLKSWSNEELKEYTSFYSRDRYYDKFRGNFKQFKEYKKQVFWGVGKPEINISDISIFKLDTYAVIQFTQHYKSKSIDDIGRKELYLQKDDYYNWKIISEVWRKSEHHAKPGESVAFRPSMRFFKQPKTSNN